MKPIVRRAQVDSDLQQVIEYYQEHAPECTGSFIDAIQKAFQHISEHSGTGSTRYAHELDLPDLWTWRCTGAPYLVFYVERTDVIDVWRVLHEHRDIPQSLQASDSP